MRNAKPDESQAGIKIARRNISNLRYANDTTLMAEIEESNRMGKTRDLVKKIKDTKGTLHAKMPSIKDRNCLYLTEAEDIKKTWLVYTKELYKTVLHNPEITMV